MTISFSGRRTRLPERGGVVLGEIEWVRVSILVSATGPSESQVPPPVASNGDRLLTVAETAAKLGRSRWWVYANKDSLPKRRGRERLP